MRFVLIGLCWFLGISDMARIPSILAKKMIYKILAFVLLQGTSARNNGRDLPCVFTHFKCAHLSCMFDCAYFIYFLIETSLHNTRCLDVRRLGPIRCEPWKRRALRRGVRLRGSGDEVPTQALHLLLLQG